MAGIAALKVWVQSLSARYSTYFPAGVQDMGAFFAGAPNAQKIGFFVTDGAPDDAASNQTARQIAEGAAVLVAALQGVKVFGVNIDLQDLTYTALVDNSGAPVVVAGSDSSALTAVITSALGGLVGMNPAHMIYDSLVSQNMQGEPAALVNAVSFTAAADKLFSEGFGLCTKYDPDAESVEAFRARICGVIGASCSRSRVNGQWYLDLIRGDTVRADLPVLTDNDILEYEEEPSLLDDAVNQVVVEWFDPEAKEDRSTAPLHALGAIRATGGVISETIQYPEIPIESLALRAGARELRSRATPLKRFRLTCNRTPYSWRIGTYFRLQAPRRGIADMVCLVGEIDTGTLRSGAIPLVAIQDVFGMPSTTYVVEQPTDNGASGPVPPPFKLLLEAPYVELAGTLSHADLAALPPDAGYLVAAAARPTSGTNYRLYTAAAGEAFAESVVGDWCPTATLVEAAGVSQTAFSLSSQSLLSRVSVGTAAAWDSEIVRVDALNTAAGTIVLGRGCADTVPVPHAAGSRLFFYDEWGASDGREYSVGEVVSAKLVSRSGASALTPGGTLAISLTMNERAARPYPPAGLMINGDANPIQATGLLTVTWRHRDRLLQANQLIDGTAASIGPEVGTTYNIYWSLNGVLVQTHTGIAGTSQAFTPPESGRLRVEVEAKRGERASWQLQSRELDYVSAANVVHTRAAGTMVINASGTATVLSAPPGTVVGDLLVACVMRRSLPASDPPPGWTRVSASAGATNGTFNQYSSIYTKTAEASDLTGTTTFAQASSGRNAGQMLAIYANSGVPIVESESRTTVSNSTAAETALPVLTSLGAGRVGVAVGSSGLANVPPTATSVSVTGPWILRSPTSVLENRLVVATQMMRNAATTSGTVTWSFSAGNNGQFTINVVIFAPPP